MLQKIARNIIILGYKIKLGFQYSSTVVPEELTDFVFSKA